VVGRTLFLTCSSPTGSLFSICEPLIKGHTRALAMLAEIEKIVHFYAKTANEINDLLWFGPCSVQFIVGNLSSVYTNQFRELLTTEV